MKPDKKEKLVRFVLRLAYIQGAIDGGTKKVNKPGWEEVHIEKFKKFGLL